MTDNLQSVKLDIAATQNATQTSLLKYIIFLVVDFYSDIVFLYCQYLIFCMLLHAVYQCYIMLSFGYVI